MQEEQRTTPRATLPFAIGIAVLALYLITLNQWVSVRSLGLVSKVTGWDWTPITAAPLFHLLTWPLRLLPGGAQPIALNIFSALCGAVAVGLLARSIQLLPHDRTHDQRLRERSEFSLLSIRFAWLPVVLGAAVFGLELTMWEHSTAATGESLDVLLLGVSIWCLLEYRISLNEKWLTWMAFIYGLGVTNNWAMIGLFPFALGAIIWIKGLGFFNSRFILKLMGAGVAGLLLYFFLPIVWVLQKDASMTFWEVLRSIMATQKMYLADTPPLRVRALVLGLTSLLPVIIMGIRWPTTVGDTSKAGAVLTHFFIRVIHFVFFGICLAMALNLKFSPRELGFGLPFLSFYYLGALALGYYAGFLLLVHRPAPKKGPKRSSAGEALYPVAHALVWAALIAMPAYLVYKNLPEVRANNGKTLKELFALTAAKLPKTPAALLGEDSFQLQALQAYLATTKSDPGHVFVNTRLLSIAGYQERLVRRHGNLWPKPQEETVPGASYSPLTLANQVYSLSSSNKLYYLNPSFGYFFEDNYLIPRGLVYELKPYPAGAIFPPAPNAELIAENESFWQKALALAPSIESHRGAGDAAYAGMALARALNYWGRELNHNGRREAALAAYEKASLLNTNNVPARVNFEFASLRAGRKVEETTKETDLYGGHRTLDMLMLQSGPYDHPQRSFAVAESFLQQRMARQAASIYRQVAELDPGHYEARMALAGAYLHLGQADLALETVKTLRGHDAAKTNQLKLVALEASAFAAKRDFASAERALMGEQAKNPKEIEALGILTELYRSTGQTEKALEAVERQIKARPDILPLRFQRAEFLVALKRYDEARKDLDIILQAAPKDVTAWLQHAFISIQTQQYERALKEVEKALQEKPRHPQALTYKGLAHFHLQKHPEALRAFDQVIEENPEDIIALRNRALTHLRLKNFDMARDDYETLLKMMPRSPAVYYGLGEVAYQQKDRAEALKNYELYLKTLGNGTLDGELQKEKESVESRIAELKGK
ncbi:MAG TPA: tetratricopeptide repeat protein [Methylomirabilota bacterium]|nr:tetratricopeptide repeat protein [Methylomirabilota bacterium]